MDQCVQYTVIQKMGLLLLESFENVVKVLFSNRIICMVLAVSLVFVAGVVA